MKTPEEIAQWVIDNRYPKSENENTTDSEMYHFLVQEISQFQQPKKETKTIEERKSIFNGLVCLHIHDYGYDMLESFFEYWTETAANGKKMRFEKEKVFDIKKRLERWKRNQKNFNNGKQSTKPTTDDAIGSFVSGQIF